MNEFIWSENPEPHYSRRKQILEEFPEVKQLFGIDPKLKFKVLIPVVLQLAIPFYIDVPIWLFLILVVVIGTTMTHIIVLAIHEVTHDLAFKRKEWNNILAILLNFPLLFPFAMAFKQYHADHHWHQGERKIDVDIPSYNEARFFTGRFGKLLWLFLQIPFYALRPLFIHPRKPDTWQWINISIQLIFVLCYYFFVGWMGLFYLFLSLALAGGLHPLGGHFIAEHYLFDQQQETYSYYGRLNRLVFNVGYHNEHHDFPNIPGSKLPKLKSLAGKHYDQLKYHTSWTKVIWNFIMMESLSLYSRIKR